MSASVAELNELFCTLDQTRGRKKLAASQSFCRAIINAQRRGELGILPAISFIEAALQYPELQEHEQVVPILERAAAVQSPLRPVSHDLVRDWRELVKRIEQLRV